MGGLSLNGFLNVLKNGLKTVKKNYVQVNLAWLSAGYFFHLWIRMLHDKTYEKVPVYKKYSDAPISSTVHKTVMWAFVASFTFFTLFQYVLPNIFPANKAYASSNTKTWTTNADFANNKSSICGALTSDGNVTVNPSYNDPSCAQNESDGSATLSFGYQKLTGITKIAVSAVSSDVVALRGSDGAVFTWGDNTYGQLGDNTTTSRNTPVQVLGVGGSGNLTSITAIASGSSYSLALRSSDGAVFAWGLNSSGQLGDNTTTQRNTPVQVLGVGGSGNLTGITAIAAGDHTVALRGSDGAVFDWGTNGSGQLGDNTTTQRNTPVQVLGVGGTGNLTGITAIASGSSFSLAARGSDGAVFAWGTNSSGQLGDNTTTQRNTPVQVLGVGGSGNLTGITAVAAGYSHAVGLRGSDGAVFAWGYNNVGQLGDNTSIQRKTPVQVLGVGGTGNLTGITAIAAGYYHTVALRGSDGAVFDWGNNAYGSLGDNTSSQRNTPIQVLGVGGTGNLTGITSIAAGDYQTAVVRGSDKTVFAWGYNNVGQLGINSSDSNSHATPVQTVAPASIGTLTGITKISAKYQHVLAIRGSDGAVFAWGLNGQGQLGDGTTTARNYPVQVRYGLGYLTGITEISAGGSNSGYSSTDFGSSFAIRGSDGAVFSWGNMSGTYVPVQVAGVGGNGYLTGITKIVSSGFHTLAIRGSDGAVFAWGQNTYGQLGDNTTTQRSTPVQVLGVGGTGNLTGITSIDCSAYDPSVYYYASSYAVRGSDGAVFAWGYNGSGQLGDNTTIQRNTPVQVLGVGGTGNLFGMTTVSSNATSALVLRGSDGALFGWGTNSSGQLGDNTTTQRNTPVQVLGVGGTGNLTGIAAVSAGWGHTVALRGSDGAVFAWGSNYQGQLGDNTTTQRNTPVQVLGVGGTGNLTGMTMIQGGSFYSLALRNSDGAVFAWGYNNYGQLGVDTASQINTPVHTSTRSLSIDNNTYQYSGSVDGYIIDTGAGSKAYWNTVSWNATTPTNTSVKFNVRTSDNGTSWSSWSSDLVTPGGSAITASQSRYLDIQYTLSSDGTATSTLNDFSLNYNSVEAPINTNTTIYKSDGSTPLKSSAGSILSAGAAGGYTNESSVKIKTTSLSCSGCGTFTNPYTQVEYKPVGIAFTGTTNLINGAVDSGNQSTATITGLSSGTSYHFQMRTLDAQGRQSGWTSYGTTPEDVNEADITVDTTKPTVVVTINGGAQFTPQNATINVVAADAGGSNLGKLYFSNDGSNWTDVTPASGFTGQSSYSGNVPWTLTGGDGTKSVYTKIADNAGNTNADNKTWTTNADFSYNKASICGSIINNGNAAVSPSYTDPTCAANTADGTVTLTFGPQNLTGITAISAEWSHTIAVRGSDGAVFAWGSNGSGQLGDNTTTQRNIPVQVLGVGGTGYLTGITAVSAGGSYSLALRGSDGAVFSWGDNGWSQLGNNSVGGSTRTPAQVVGVGGSGYLTGITSISAGSEHSLALRGSDGAIFAWGRNAAGQLGDNTTTQRNAPVQVVGVGGSGFLTGNSMVSSGFDPNGNGYDYSLSVRSSDGAVFAWGYNGYGELGDNTTTQRNAPVQVKGLGGIGNLVGIAAVATGSSHSIALRSSDSAVFAWGNNNYGQLGDNTVTQRNVPIQVLGVGGSGNLVGITAISAGKDGSSLALRGSDGALFDWGYNGYGQLGINSSDSNSHAVPIQVLGVGGSGNLTGMTTITSGGDYSVARRSSDGAVFAWGYNSYGNLGDNTTSQRNVPVQTISVPVIYNTLGTISGYKLDAGVGAKQKWGNISWNSVALPAGTSIKFQARTSDDGVIWSDPSWGNTGATQSTTGSTTGSLDNSSLVGSRYFDVQVTLATTNNLVTPTLNDFTLGSTYGYASAIIDSSPPNDISTILGYSQSGGTALTSNNWYGYNVNGSKPFFSWTAPSDNGLAGVYGYCVYWGTAGITDPGTGCTTANAQTATNFSNNQTLVSGSTYYLNVKAIDNAGNASSTSAQFIYKYDNVAPTTTLNVSPSTPSGDNSWYKIGKPVVSFSAADSGSKTNKIYYRFDTDAAPYTQLSNTNGDDPYIQTLDASNLPEGTHTLYWYADDVAGNAETHHSQQFKIDVQAPTTGYAISPTSPNGDNGWYVTNAPVITLAPTDPNSGNNSGVASTYYQWDSNSGTWSTYTSTLTVSQGAHTLYYYTKDTAGNAEGQQQQTINFNAFVPNAPSGFRAPASDPNTDSTHIQLYWNSVSGTAPTVAYQTRRILATGTWGVNEVVVNHGSSDISYLDSTGLQPGLRYKYEIRTQDNSGLWGSWSDPIDGLTTDSLSPTPVVGVLTTACDGTTGNIPTTSVPVCSNTANKGFEIALTWTPSNDYGVGMSRYLIYRSTTNSIDPADWQIVGTLDATSVLTNPVYYDNDTNNDATFGTDKPVATDRLNDSTTYFYRVTALDLSPTGNPTGLIPLNPFDNLNTATTPDITAPTVPTNVVASPMGLDSSGSHQRIHLTWTASIDYKARSEEVVPGTITYKIFEATTEGGSYTQVATTTSLTTDLNGKDEFTDYYYQINASDASPAHNESAHSTDAHVHTASNSVPTTPTEVNVTAATGNPNTDSSVGHQITVTFFGSLAKNCDKLANVRCLTKYEVYRSTTNYADDASWTANATKIAEVAPTKIDDDRKKNDADQPHSVTDTGQTFPATSGTGLTDATTYYYKVMAIDNTPVTPDGGPFHSPMSTIAYPGSLHIGWDNTPDATAPALPSNVIIHDIHGDGVSYLRNIISWSRIPDPNRNGINDFKEYRIYRSVDGLFWQQICTKGLESSGCSVNDPNPLYNVDQNMAMGNNYYIDPISSDPQIANQMYYYYVTSADNASTTYKYPTPNGNLVVNAVTNESKPPRDSNNKITNAVSLNPATTQPSICDIGTDPCTVTAGGQKADLTNIGVATATINWTTDQPADSMVEFRKAGTDDAYKQIGDGDSSRNLGMVTSHSVDLFGLQPSTSYQYIIVSRNFLSNAVTAETSNLPTLTTTGFNITPGTVTTTTSTAEINWTTNLDASSAFIEYQLQTQPGDDPQGGTSGVDPSVLALNPQKHQVVIKGLRSNRTYTYKIKSISMDGYLAENPIGSFSNFKTRNFDSAQFSLAPASSNVADRNITSTTAQIIWQTATETTSWVDYGTVSGVYGISSGDDNLTTTHLVTLEGLVPGTTYYYHVRVKDANEVEFTSQEYSFTAVIKPKISNLQVKNVTPYSITIAWDTNVDTETVLNWGKTASYGTKEGTSDVSQVHQVTVDNLDDNTEYHYQIVAHDAVGNEVVGSDGIVRTPLDTEGPKVTNVKLDVLPMGESDTTASIIVSWQTNKPSTTLVQYDEGVVGGTYSKSSVLDTTLNNSHTVIIKDLAPASSYHYRLVSADKRNNTTTTQDYTFVTPTKEQSILQLILKSFEDTFAWTGNMNQFFGNVGKRLTGK